MSLRRGRENSFRAAANRADEAISSELEPNLETSVTHNPPTAL